eukprot:Awhi_evm1s8900
MTRLSISSVSRPCSFIYQQKDRSRSYSCSTPQKKHSLGDPQHAKFVMLGDCKVGKTSIVNQFISGEYSDAYTPTLEDTYWKIVKGEDKYIAETIEITDLTGDQNYSFLTLPHLKKGTAFMIVFRVDDRSSFLKIPYYLDLIEQSQNKPLREIPITICGNKAELYTHQRLVGIEESQKFCKSFNFEYFEVSAKENCNIAKSYHHLVCKWKSLENRSKSKGKKRYSNSNVDLVEPLSKCKMRHRSKSYHAISRGESSKEIKTTKSDPTNIITTTKTRSCIIEEGDYT